jgi:hypothetical protein
MRLLIGDDGRHADPDRGRRREQPPRRLGDRCLPRPDAVVGVSGSGKRRWRSTRSTPRPGGGTSRRCRWLALAGGRGRPGSARSRVWGRRVSIAQKRPRTATRTRRSGRRRGSTRSCGVSSPGSRSGAARSAETQTAVTTGEGLVGALRLLVGGPRAGRGPGAVVVRAVGGHGRLLAWLAGSSHGGRGDRPSTAPHGPASRSNRSDWPRQSRCCSRPLPRGADRRCDPAGGR